MKQFNITVFGSKGRMGAMLSSRLSKAGFNIQSLDQDFYNILSDNNKTNTSDQNDLKTELNILANAHIILLCVPVSKLYNLLKTITPKLNTNQLLVDITSVKIHPCNWMEELFDGPIIGSHPLFGPNPKLSDMKVALVKRKKATDEHVKIVEQMYEAIGSTFFWCTAEEHDKGVAFTQSMNFTVSTSFFSLLSHHPDINNFLTPSFIRHKDAAEKHLTIDSEMFCEFIAWNPYFPRVLDEFIDNTKRAVSGEMAELSKEAKTWYAKDKSCN